MDFIKYVRVRLECAETRLSAKQDHSSAIFGARVIGRVSVSENTPAQGDELIGTMFNFYYHRYITHASLRNLISAGGSPQ